jgi:hypothetical protein
MQLIDKNGNVFGGGIEITGPDGKPKTTGGLTVWGSITGTLSSQTDLQTALNGKQATLISATNIKTINGNSILGSGDLTVSGSNIYNADGTLTAARTLTQGGFDLTIAGTTSSRFFSNGNVGIGTTTNAGFKLDVNGTARVSNHVDGLSFSATGSANTRTTSIGTFLDFQTTHGRLFSFNFNTNAWLPILTGESRIIMSTSLGTRTERLVGTTASFSGSVKSLSVENYFGPTENNGIYAPATYSNANYPVIENNSIGILAGIVSVNNSAFIAAAKISFQIGTGTNSKIAQFSPTSGNFIVQNGGTFTDITSALIQVNSTTKGFLPPRMTNAQMLAIATPAAGLVVYDTTNNKHCGYNGTAWQNFY